MTSWTLTIGWTLVHFIWQGALLALVAAAGLRFYLHRSPQSRYAIACIALAAMSMAPLVTLRALTSSPSSVQVLSQSSKSAVGMPSGAPTSRIEVDAQFRGGDQSGGRSDFAQLVPLDRLLPVGVLAWLIGVALLSLRLCGGWWRTRQMHETMLAAAASSWQEACDQLASRMGVGRMIHVTESLLLETATLIGWLRPVIVLPVAALANLTPGQVEAILAHEIAHVRRHDYLVNLLQTLTETVLFYHPAVWWLSARVREAREECCDTVAVAVCGDAEAYAAALFELEARRTAPALALAAASGPLLKRIARILRVPPPDHRASPGGVFVIGLALVFAVALPTAEWVSRGTDHAVALTLLEAHPLPHVATTGTFFPSERVTRELGELDIQVASNREPKRIESARFEPEPAPQTPPSETAAEATHGNDTDTLPPSGYQQPPASHYQNPVSGIEFNLPAGWNRQGTSEWSGGRTERWTRFGLEGAGGPVSINVWMPDPTGLLPTRLGVAQNTPEWLNALITNKTRQRAAEHYPDWHARPESVKYTPTANGAVVVAAADWRQSGGTPRVEYLAWVYGSKSRIQFFSFADPNQFDALQADVDRVVQSVKMP